MVYQFQHQGQEQDLQFQQGYWRFDNRRNIKYRRNNTNEYCQLSSKRSKESSDHSNQGVDQLKQGKQACLITFNQKAKVALPLTDRFDEIINQIQRQEADGQTAQFDSLKFAANQLRGSENPRILIMTDGQDNCSNERCIEWAREWFGKDGLKSTFFTICQGNNQINQQLARELPSQYVNIGEQCWFRTASMMPRWQEEQGIQNDLTYLMIGNQVYISTLYELSQGLDNAGFYRLHPSPTSLTYILKIPSPQQIQLVILFT